MTQTKVEAPFVENNRPFRNLIINGDMSISQRGTSQSGVANNANEGHDTPVDRFGLFFYGNEGGVATVSRDSDVPSDTTYGKFNTSIKIDVTTADTSIGTTGSHSLQQTIESSFLFHSGWDYTNPSSKITLQFWAKSVKAGDYCVNLQAPDATRYYVAQYTLVANTWKHVEIVIPGNSDLVFNNDNGDGLEVRWMLSTGDDRDGATAGSWFNPGSDYFQSTSSQVNFFDSTDNEFFLTGVQLEVGDVASAFEHLPTDIQQYRCERYYQVIDFTNTFAQPGNAYTASAAVTNFRLHTEMRADPTITLASAGGGSGGLAFLTSAGGYPSTVGTHTAGGISTHQFKMDAGSYSGLENGGASPLYVTGHGHKHEASAEY